MLPESLAQLALSIYNELSTPGKQREATTGFADSEPMFIVMRGLPGSGKSSVSKEIQRLFQTDLNEHVVRICTDEILEMCEGSYLWAGWKMPLYHSIALKMAQRAFSSNVPVVILDNTNMQKKDYEHYIFDAKQKGYTCHEFTVGEFTQEAIELSFTRNSHNVPHEAIQGMARKFQA